MRVTRILATALTLLAAACTDTGSGPGGGTQILLTDSPFPFDRIARVDVHIVRIEAATSLDTMPGASGWVNVVEPRRTINLLDLQGGATTLLGDVDLAAGSYRAVRLTINTALSSMTGIDGSNIPVQWGVNGELSMYAYVEDPLPVSGSGGRIVIDFDVGRSFQIIGDDFHFIPWIRAVNDAATGSISGTVRIGDSTASSPLANASVSVYRGGPESHGWLAATARTDAQGRYTVAFLPHDAYWVVMHAPYTIEGRIESCAHIDSVMVAAGQVSTVDRRLPTYDPVCLGGGGTNPDTSGTDTTVTPPGGAVATVSVTLSPTQLAVGDSAWGIAQLRDASGAILSGRSVTWTTSNAAVLSIAGQFGLYAYLRPQSAGTATLTATSEGKAGSITVTVGGGVGGGTVTHVTLSPNGFTAKVADTMGLHAFARNASGMVVGGQTYAFAIGDTTIGRIIHQSGNYVVVRALKVGSTTLTASSAGKSVSANVNVVADTTGGGGGGAGAPVATVTIVPASVTILMTFPDSTGVTAVLKDSTGATLTGRAITWSVADTTVVRIRQAYSSGVILSATRIGATTITATSGGKSGTASITVQ